METKNIMERIKTAFANDNVTSILFASDGSCVYFKYTYNFTNYFSTLPMAEAIECMKGMIIK